MNIRNLTISFFVLFLCQSCLYKSENERLIENARKFVNEDPELCISILDSVNTKLLNKPLKAEYTILQIRAKDKAEQDISTHTEIFKLKDYYSKKKDFKNAALACLYSGNVYYSRKEFNRAVIAYKEALQFLDGQGQYEQQGLIESNIGHLLYSQRRFNESFKWFEKSYYSFNKEVEDKRISSYKAHNLSSLGKIYSYAGNKDSALVMYHRALEIAEKYDDTQMQAMIWQDIGVANKLLEKFELAKDNFHQSAALYNTDSKRFSVYINLADVFIDTDQLDSAVYYIKIAENMMDSTIYMPRQVFVLNTKSKLEEKRGNLEDALQLARHQLQCSDKIYEAAIDSSVLEVKKRYEYEHVQKENDLLTIQKHRRAIFIVIAVLLLITVISLTILVNAKRLKHKTELLEAKEKLRLINEQEKKRRFPDKQNGNESGTKDQNKNVLTQAFRRLLTERYKIIGKVEKAKTAGDPSDILNSIKKEYPKGLINYNALISLMPEVMMLITKLGKLSKGEKCVCCLTWIGYDITELEAYLGLSATTVYAYNSKIRRNTGIKEMKNRGAKGDIKEYLDEVIK